MSAREIVRSLVEARQKIVDVPLKHIRRWQDTNPENVEHFRQAIRKGDKLPPIKITKDSLRGEYGRKYVIRDGSHRYHAYELEGKKSIKAEIL